MPRTSRYNVIDYNYEKTFRDRGSRFAVEWKL